MHVVLRKVLGEYAALPRGVWVIFAAQIVNRMGDFVIPFLSLFLTLKIGVDPTVAGVFLMATSLASMFGGLWGARLADLHGRKWVLGGFQGLAGIIIGSCGFLEPGLSIPFILIASNFFQGAVKPILSAMTADLSSLAQRRFAFSLSYMGINLGVAIGPLIAAFLFNTNLHLLFWLDALSTFAAVVLVLRFIPETMPEKAKTEPASSHKTIAPQSALRSFIAHPLLLIYGILFMVTQLVYVQINFALPLYLQFVDPVNGTTIFGTLAAINAVTVIVSTAIIVRITKRMHALNVMGFGMLLIALGFGMMSLRLSIPLIFLSTVLWSLGEVFFTTMAGAFVSTHSPVDMRARFQSFVSVLANTGNLLSPLFAGILIPAIGLYNVWIVVGALGLVAVLGLLLLRRRDRNEIAA